jgi:hypothetical protein
VKREPGESFKLFLGLGNVCICVRWRRWERRNERRSRRRSIRSIREMEDKTLKSVSLCGESTVGELDILKDNRRREENTLVELRCCSNLCRKKTEEKDIIKLFKLVILDRRLNRRLNGKFCDTKPLELLVAI